MKKMVALAAVLLAVSLVPFWSCSRSGEAVAVGPIKPDTTGKDTTKAKPDTTKPDTTKPDTVKADTTKHVSADSAALIRLMGAMADTGVAAGLESIRSKGFDVDVDPIWKQVASDTAGYAYSIRQYGLFKRIHVVSRVKAGAFHAEKRTAVRVGNVLGLDDFPSFGILWDESLGLAREAEVEGPVYIPNGQYQLLKYDNAAYTGSVKTLTVWDRKSEFAKLMPFTFKKARTWVLTSKQQIATFGSSPVTAADPEWETTEAFDGDKVLAGKTWDGAKLICPGKLTLGAGLVLKDCLVMASEIRIEGNAQVSGLAFASGSMTIDGQPYLKGQFIAGDSMRIDISSPLTGYPVFYVQGQDTIGSPTGHLDIVRASGQGVFLYSGDSLGYNVDSWPPTIALGQGADLQGLAYSRGLVEASGRFRGSFIGKGPVFYQDPTLYSCCLGGGDLGLAPAGTAFPFPGILPGGTPSLSERHDWP